MATLWCNGRWLDTESPAVAWSDRGLLHGLGLFETLLAVDGDLPMATRHLARLEQGAKRLGWPLPEFDLLAAMRELLVRNGLQKERARIRLALSAGSGALNDLSSGADQLCWMTASPLSEGRKSVSLVLSLWRRNEHSSLVGLKCASYAENLVVLDWARREGHDEVLFLNNRGDLCEAACANLFLVIKGILYTPGLDSGCLPGVMRSMVFDLAKSLGIPYREDSLQLDDLKKADECFLTSATRGVIAVHAFEGRMFGDAPVAAQLAKSWQESFTRQ